MSAGLLRAAAIAVLFTVAAPAAARPLSAEASGVRAGAGDPARELATRRFVAGSAQYADGDYAAALREFEAGYAAKPSPPFLVNIGQCLLKLDRLDEAALAYRRFLDTHAGTPAVRMEVFDALEDTLTELNRRIDSLAQSAAMFRVFLAGSDGDRALRARARVTLDEIMKELTRIDDGLNAGFGVGRALVLPRAPAINSSVGNSSVGSDGKATREALVRQRLAAMAATSRPTASSTNQRSPRSASHSHIAR